MIRLTINIFAFVLMIFLSNTYAQYDLSTIDGIKGCMSDNNCYVCTNLLDNGSFEAKQCVQLSPYDEKLGIIDSTKSDLVCNAPSSTKVCSIETDDKILEEKKVRLNSIISAKEIFGNNYSILYHGSWLAGWGIGYGLDNSTLTVGYAIPRDGIWNKWNFDLTDKIRNNTNIKSYEQENWKIKDIKIYLMHYVPKHCENIGGDEYCYNLIKEYISYDIPSSTYSPGYINNHGNATTNFCVNANVKVDKNKDGLPDINEETGSLVKVTGRACIDHIDVEVTLERPKTTITCPYGSNYPCYLENNEYICNKNKCDAGSNMDVTENPEQGTPVIKPPKKEGIESGCVEDMSKVTIAEGTLGMCRLSSRTNALADNCCKISVNDRDKQEDIMTGVADVISVIGGTYSLISDLFKALGWADEDFIQVLLTDVMEFLKGGTCSNDEIAIATAAAATQGIVVNNNGITYDGNNDSGTCVYLGDYCTNYSGTCHKWFGQIIGWDGQCERPARAYCCYSSMFEKALAKAAREQMPDKYNWGNIRGYPLWPYKSKYGEPYTPGNNPCEPDFKELNIDCKGVSVFDLININMDSEQFQTDMAAFTAITLKDVTKEGGNYQQAQENMQQEIDNLKNQSNTNSGAIIDNMLDGVDINKFK